MTKIKDESIVSRLLQQQIPQTDGILDTHSNITQFDTADKNIADDLNKEFIPANEVVYVDEIITTNPKSFEFVENVPTSNLTEYDKISVLIDRDDHLFYFDRTPNNKRVALRHPTGTRWNIDDDGNYNFKSMRDYNKIVKGSDNSIINLGQNVLIKNNRKLSIKGNDYSSIAYKKNLTVGTDYGVIIGGDELRNITGKRITLISGEESIKVAKYKTQEINGLYGVISKTSINLQAPIITIDAGRFIIKSKSSIIESTSGIREIRSEKLVLSGMDGISITSMGNLSQVVKGISEETISGVPSLPSGTDMKITTVSIGGYRVTTTAGAITLESILPLPVSISNLLGSIEIGVTGALNLSSPTADVSIKETGEIELNGATGSVKLGLANTEIDHSIMIKIGSGASSEFAVLGMKLMTAFNSHIHPSGTGPTGPVLKPLTPIDIGSTKVFIE